MLFTLVAGMLTVRFWGIESVGYIYEAVLLFLPRCDKCSRCINQKSCLPVARCYKGELDEGQFYTQILATSKCYGSLSL